MGWPHCPAGCRVWVWGKWKCRGGGWGQHSVLQGHGEVSVTVLCLWDGVSGAEGCEELSRSHRSLRLDLKSFLCGAMWVGQPGQGVMAQSILREEQRSRETREEEMQRGLVAPSISLSTHASPPCDVPQIFGWFSWLGGVGRVAEQVLCPFCPLHLHRAGLG